MTERFFRNPILNSPYERPGRHWELDEDRRPTGVIVEDRRQSKHITAVPKHLGDDPQAGLEIGVAELSTADQQYDPMPVINAIRGLEPVTRTSFQDGVAYMEFTEAVTKSAQARRTVSLPL